MTTVILSVFICNYVYASYDFSVDGFYYTIISESEHTVEISKNDDVHYNGNIIIQPSVTKYGETYTVTRIGNGCFSYCEELYTINIPETIDSISYNAFFGCKSLKEINIEEKNPYFKSKDGVVFDKTMTKILHFPNMNNEIYRIPNGVKIVKSYSFVSNDNLKSLTLPSSVTIIESYAFDCQRLNKIQLSEHLEYIGDYAFSNSLIYGISLPESLKHIGEYAFNNCKNINNISFPESLMFIGKYAFNNCNNIKTIYIPKNVESLSDEGTFGICLSLERIDVDPDNQYYTSINGILYNKELTKILQCPSNNKELEWITLPKSITKICINAFNNNKNLTRIVIPAGVTIIDNDAFYNCSNLNRVTCYANNPPSTPIIEGYENDPWIGSGREKATLYVPKGSLNEYEYFSYITSQKVIKFPYSRFKEIVEMDEDTGISPSFIDNNDHIISTYNTIGVKTRSTTNGLNIIKYRNGSTKKIIK